MKLLDYPRPDSIAPNGGYIGNDTWKKYAADYLKKLANVLGKKCFKISQSGSAGDIAEVVMSNEDKEVFFTFNHVSGMFSCMARNKGQSKGSHGLGGRNHFFKWEDVRYFEGFADKIKNLNDYTIVMPRSLTALFRG